MNNTIEKLKKQNCTGCKSCGDACPFDAIEFYDEVDGFWYPRINHDKCVNCGLCTKKCPGLNDADSSGKTVLKCYGVKSKNEKIRYNSTSGGFFSVLAKKWIDDGGIVVGAEYNDSNLVYHTYSSDKNDICKLRQSKYVQSDTQGIYKKVKEFLDSNQKVLFCGTPCQVEALLFFLAKPYDNLLTLDFVCCGICSPGIYKLYLKELEQKYNSKIKKVWFKNKEEGWRNIGTRIDFENGKHYFRTGSRDLFMTSFVTDALSMRLSCEECKYRKLPHRSDIMLGDFWGIENINPSFDDNRGVSAVLLNSKKGTDAFESIQEELDYFETTKEDIAKGNFTIFEPKHINPLRSDFINLMNKKGFKIAMSKYSKYSGIDKIRTDISYYKSKLKKCYEVIYMGRISIKSAISRYIKGMQKIEINVNNVSVVPNQLLQGKCAIVTGAGSGIGMAIAKTYINSGAVVIGLGRNRNKLDEAQNILGDNFIPYTCDISDVENISKYLEEIIEKSPNGKIDILVNSAGVKNGNDERFFEFSPEEFDSVIDTNIKAVFFWCQQVSKHMISKKIHGHIVNVASIKGFIGEASPYSVSKWGVVGLTKGLGRILAPKDIVVNGLAPGGTLTPMAHIKDNSMLHLATPSMRLADPNEMANIALFLGSDLGNNIIGEVIISDGGQSLQYGNNRV